MECLKTLFPHRTAFTIAKPESFSDGQILEEIECEFKSNMNRLIATVKKNVTHKEVCGKAINGNMLLALSLEYAEVLSTPAQTTQNLTLPGQKSSPVIGNLLTLFTAFQRVSEEETMRIFDLVYSQF